MLKKIKLLTCIFIILSVIIISASGCSIIPTSAKANPGPDIVKQAWDIVNENYVDPSLLNSQNMTSAAIRGLVEALNDPYSVYLSPEQLKSAQSNLSGSYAGIGAVISIIESKVTIIDTFANTPASRAGLKEGDIIVTINGLTTVGMTADQAASKIRGSAGNVQLTILHPGDTEPVAITLNINTVNVPSVSFKMMGDYAYVIISQFTSRTGAEFVPIVTEIKAANARGIVLDLRGNPGGVLESVIEVVSQLIPSGVVVKVRDRRGKVITDNVKSGYQTTDVPIVVLVDEDSASGSEVLAGALQDHNRALIAGNTTYGKGSVNYLYELADGSGVYLTSARWLTPNDHLIEGEGISPDMKLDLTGDDLLNWALNYLKTGLH